MSLRLPIGLGRSLFHTGQIRPLNTGFFSSISPLRAAPSSKPIASSITGLCFFSPSSFVRSAPRIPLGQLLSLHGQARSPFDGLARRAFSTGRPGWMRQTYFPKRGGGYGGGGSGGGGGGPSWFRNFRNRIDSIPPMVMVYGLIAVNVGVYLIWQYAMQSWQRFRDPSLYYWMVNNFVLNEANIMAGRVWTLVTACFSHSSGQHIFMNCLGLYFIAPAVAGLLGSSAFMGLYLAGGIFASLVSLSWRRVRGEKWNGSEGASGAIYSCLAFYGALFPTQQFLLFFVLPLPAWAMIGGIFAYDAYGAIFRPGSGTDSAGHVGGILAGLGAALLVRRRGFRGFRF